MVTSCSKFVSIKFAHACVHLPHSMCIAVEYGSNNAGHVIK